jgi:hypothetical protein
VGFYTYDNVRVLDPTEVESDSSFDGIKPTVSLDPMPFLSVNMASQPFSTLYDGFVGLAPYTYSENVRDNKHNFMYNLKSNLGLIDHMIASVFIT